MNYQQYTPLFFTSFPQTLIIFKLFCARIIHVELMNSKDFQLCVLFWAHNEAVTSDYYVPQKVKYSPVSKRICYF
jgi:hypothetical protein